MPRHPDAAEDDGWVLSFVHDATTDTSDVAILVAQDFSGDPIATITSPSEPPSGSTATGRPTWPLERT